jgi:eukaryotic-like serine/threonine-protein kinase
MPIGPGSRLGPYEVTALIGEGGMGKVWRAHHTALKRDDALKVLPDAFASDPDRWARFRREAQVLASLNHPNIAHVYGLEQSDGVQALVMELVEGSTLADRIAQGPIPVDEALPIARQIAEALEAAHEQGIIHRDLKPANIKLRPDGMVKVLDFGLAKALEPARVEPNLSDSPTITSPAMTQRGVILGTAAYMSPEQARGRTVDRRSDIWAFGCVLYEMLTRRRAFEGNEVTDVLASVLAREPDWTALPSSLSGVLLTFLKRCLHKDRKQRIGDAQSLRLALEGAFDGGVSQAAVVGVPRLHGWRRLALPAMALLAGLVVASIAAWRLWPVAVPASVSRFDHVVGGNQPQFRGIGTSVVALSPDGRHFVYNTPNGLYLRRMSELDARLIPGTEDVLFAPFFSPDGQTIAFFGPGQLRRLAVSGGTPVTVCGTGGPTFGGTWAADNTILFGSTKGIMRVPAIGGTPELVIPAMPGEQLSSPQLLPDGDSVLFTVATGLTAARWDAAQIALQSLRGGDRMIIWQGGSDAQYAETGHILFAVGDALFAIAFDAAQRRVFGGPVAVVQGLTRPLVATGSTGTANYAVSNTGTLLYLSGARLVGGGPAGPRTLVWVGRDGRETSLSAPARAYTYARLSPDGARAALDVRDQQLDLWIWDFMRETLTRLTFDDGEDEFPAWSPDGKRIAFSSSRGDGSAGQTSVFWVAADGTGAVERLMEGKGQLFPASFSPDSSSIVAFGAADGSTENDDVALIPMSKEGPATSAKPELKPLLHTMYRERNPSLSPDGRWLAYESNESGRDEIYVRPFPAVDGGRWQVSTGGGIQPVWARNNRELFYRSGDALMAVPIEASSGFAAGNPTTLFKGEYLVGPGGRTYDVSPDGRRFLMIKPAPFAPAQTGPPPRIIVVENWDQELKRLVPTR